MDAIQILIEDHERVKSLFDEFESKDDPADMRGIADTLFRELRIHETIEEEVFYPALKQKADEEGRELVLESFQEHHVMDVLMEEIEGLDDGDAAMKAKMTVLRENVEHHVEEEENELFEKARDVLGGDLDRIGGELMARKQALMAQAEIPPPPSADM